MSDADQQQTAPSAAMDGERRRLRLGRVQEQRLRQWPKDRIRPKSVALGVMSLLAEVDALRAERDALREALQWYAEIGLSDTVALLDDYGQRARAALVAAQGEGRGRRDA